MKAMVEIIIPTFNNRNYLYNCLQSLIRTRNGENLMHITVVNNGHPESCNWIDPKHKWISVINTGENLGWEGGLIAGLKNSDAEFVVFLNDDIIVPDAQRGWLSNMLQHFRDPKVGAVGPSSNMVMGFQNMLAFTDSPVFTVKFLIGFCMMVRRSAVEEAGGIDDTLPGGDDLDLSIRLRDKGYKLICDKNIFIFHYGSVTGNKVHGNYLEKGGWNSPLFIEKTNTALIRKHGFKKWYETQKGAYTLDSIEYSFKKDMEGELIRERVQAEGKKVIDIGCGNLKTWPHAVGLDIVPGGEQIEQIAGGEKSSADIACDVSQPLPLDDESVDIAVARHILEHMINPIQAIQNWIKPLKKGGKLVISVPNEYLIRSIPMNPEHVHGFIPESMQTLLEACGLKLVEMWDSENSISFTTVAEKL